MSRPEGKTTRSRLRVRLASVLSVVAMITLIGAGSASAAEPTIANVNSGYSPVIAWSLTNVFCDKADSVEISSAREQAAADGDEQAVTSTRENTSMTGYEAYGAGVTLTAIPEEGKDCVLRNAVYTEIANLWLGASKGIVKTATFITDMASDTSGNGSIEKIIADYITGTDGNPGLRDGFFFPAVGLMLTGLALYFGYIGLYKKQSSEAASKAVYSFAVLIAGSVLVFQPMLIPNTVTAVSTFVTDKSADLVMAGVASDVCGNPSSNDASANSGEAGASSATRKMNCARWNTYVLQPTTIAQWGTATPTMEGDYDVQVGNRIVKDNLALYQVELTTIDKFATETATQKREKFVEFNQKINDSNAPFEDAWHGNNGKIRADATFLGFVGSLFDGGGAIMFGILLIVARYTTDLLMLAAPFVLLISIFPSQRGILQRFWEKVADNVRDRAMIPILMGVMTGINSAIMLLPDLSLLTRVWTVILFDIALLTSPKWLKKVFRFGGISTPNVATGATAQKAAAVVTGGAAAAGSALMSGGGVGGAALAGLKGGGRAGASGARPMQAAAIGRATGKTQGAVSSGKRVESAAAKTVRSENKAHEKSYKSDPVYRDATDNRVSSDRARVAATQKTHHNSATDLDPSKGQVAGDAKPGSRAYATQQEEAKRASVAANDHRVNTYNEAWQRNEDGTTPAAKSRWATDFTKRNGFAPPQPGTLPTGTSGYDFKPVASGAGTDGKAAAKQADTKPVVAIPRPVAPQKPTV